MSIKRLYTHAARYAPYGWAAVDQAMFSFAGFSTNILLARSLPAAEYGVFAVAQSVFLFIVGFQNALLVEPLSVFGAQKYAARQREYFRILLAVNALFGVGAAAMLLMWRLMMKPPGMDAMLPVLASATPFLLLVWLLRKFYYLDGRVRRSVWQSSAYGVLALCGTALLSRLHQLTSTTAYSVLALASVGACAPTVLRLLASPQRRKAPPLFKFVVRDHWHFGKWVAAGSAFAAIASQGQIILAAGLGGYRVAGSVRAVSNLTMPILQLVNGVAALIIPTMARKVANGDLHGAVRVCWKFTALAVGCAAAAALVISSFAKPLVHYVCGPAYDGDAHLIPLLALTPITTVLSLGMPLLFRAVNRPRYLMVSTFAGSIASIGGAVLLIPRFGARGVIFSMLVSSSTAAITSYILYARWRSAILPSSTDTLPCRLKTAELPAQSQGVATLR